MKKIKKILAALMAMAMILGLGITSFAATTEASIKISGLTADDETNIKVYPVVVWNEQTNAWDVSSWVTEGNLDLEGDNTNWDGLKTDATKEGSTATAVYDETVDTTTAEIPGLDIGMYLVLVAGDTTVYEVMGVKTYDYENDNLIGPLKAEVFAKGQQYPLKKTFSTDDAETIVAYGEEVDYEITATFPSFGANQTDRTFWIQDNPDGLSIQNIVVKVNDETLELNEDYTLTPVVPAAEDEAVKIEFTQSFIGDNNAHATQPVSIIVTAKVEDPNSYTNSTSSNKGTGSETEVTRDTGSMLLTKVDGENEILTGAQFEVYKDGKKLEFIAMENPDEYRLALSGEDNTTSVLTVGDAGDTKGKIKIIGLGEGTYTLKEVKAPDGFAKCDDITKVIEFSDNTPAEDNAIHLEFNVVNTKLASLPETGGIGTTIFTVGGCIIMIAAAGLFFASRRKSSK